MVTTGTVPSLTSSKHTLRRIPDTEEIAGYLLTLKHRPVTPDPHLSDRSPSVESEAKEQNASSLCEGQSESPLVEGGETVSHGLLGPTGEISMPWESLIANSKLVTMQDRDLVPDCLFVAMAQMKPCRLQPVDRVGCYKSREIGFVGMSCMHCGGQPGFGRYYPNSVRSLAQTTTSQTMLKHVGGKCAFVPAAIRDAILELQRHQAIREGFPTGRPRYGSRKVFFQRVWERLHGEEISKYLDSQQQTEEKYTFPVTEAPKPAVPSDTSVGSFESSSQSDDEIARANAHMVVVTTGKRDRDYNADYYYAKRPKTSSTPQWAPYPGVYHPHHHPHHHHHPYHSYA